MTPQSHQQNLILDQGQIEQKITRMAYEMYEQNFEERELVLAGIYQNGYTLAQRLAQKLEAISPLKVQLLQVQLNKTTPLEAPVILTPTDINLDGKVVVVVDDVLNTGKTLAYTLNAFLPKNPKKVEIATLVDRHHPLYPMAATYTGYSLATTLRERVEVVLEENEVAAYLL
ncbi:pyrimidine operon attenuation protein/uracil phosphoribosyltransferase [Pontibacter aydingkolensis]|uniref:Phosphoribosyltransferase n=1 Tax=Pontibacter aydingkolensis TaxID=1911536 RepID=A0ABS7CPL6_9BACT|nr:phosphoribosyltransferase family protein [Pontibacter aydingkolensis]MBW7465631.1 phosphoribosyltransferase [Pontibacter aydingkolensis]